MLAGLTNVTFEFGARVLIEDATWHIQPNERIGLIGYNGTGKSTILKLLVGQYSPSEGLVERSRSTSIGYLHQDLLSFDTGDSILNVALGAFERVLQLEHEIEILGKKLEASSEHDAQQETLLHQYTDKLHELETLDGYTIHHRTEEVLQGLGFSNADLQRPFREFSGGWRMRVLLAKMILQQPDLLLLDEPTNHLDLPSIEWLEKYLVHYQGSVVIVSHDKYFLDRMVTKIVEVYQRKLNIYSGNYTYYEQEKSLRVEMQQRAFENQQDYIRQQERFIERFRSKASKAAQAQSALKRLEKLDRVELAEIERPNIRINFRIDRVPGKTLVTLRNVSKSFGDIRIVENASAEIDRGDKIALIGANGKGKSTLLRIIAGTESFEGERVWGHNVEESFYAQHQLEALNVNNTLLEELKSAASQQTEQELRNLLGGFLFGGEDVDKKIKVLSGGEKARVALAKTIISKANFLMLDEPTNHLDLHSVELLVDALNKYQGTMILVSHDRYFISKAANKIWEIEDQQIKVFDGNYDEWVSWKERMAKAAASQQSEEPKRKQEERPKEVVKEETTVEVIQHEPQRAINKELKKELQRQQKIFQQIEAEISVLSQKKIELEAALAAPSTYLDKTIFHETEVNYKAVQDKLVVLNRKYEEVFEQIVDLESKA